MKNFLEWKIATVKSVQPETPTVKTFTLSLPDWMPHRPGQHYDVRLTAPDGYSTQRSYSVASEPEHRGEIDLTVERIEDGEVSTYMHDILVPGDQIEVRGPIGGYFVWESYMGGPLFLVAGGSGIVPLMSMIRHRFASGSNVTTRLLFSARSPDELIYSQELDRLSSQSSGSFQVYYTLTRQQPSGWTGFARRIDRQMLFDVVENFAPTPKSYICGPTLLVEAVANTLVELGFPAATIKTERFGPTGSAIQEVKANAEMGD